MTSTKIKTLHFNDVYNIFQNPTAEIPAGASRFVRYINSHRENDISNADPQQQQQQQRRGSNYSEATGDPLVLFSGDAISPSTLSCVYLGTHIIPVLNACGVAASVTSNHDLDFGLEVFYSCRDKSNFPWLCSNAVDKSKNEPLGGGPTSHIIEHRGLKIGLLGLVEPQWMAVLYTLDPADVAVEDFVVCANRMAKQLKEKDGCDLVFALTHMRMARDRKLARGLEAGGVDLILGGHDHDAAHEVDETTGIHIVKSGSDFKELSVVELEIEGAVGERKTIKSLTCNLVQMRKEIDECPKMLAALRPFEEQFLSSSDVVIGHTAVPLDVLTNSVRTKETAIANFVAEAVRAAVRPKPDVVLFNAGTLRCDYVIPAGPIKAGDFMRLLPLIDPLELIEVSGSTLLAALENGVSQVPETEGRFPCVAGVRFAFSKSAKPGERVLRESVRVNGAPLDLEKQYKLATKLYCAQGKDGYTMFRGAKNVHADLDPEAPGHDSHENLQTLNTALRNHFLQLEIVAAFRQAAVQDPTRKRPVIRAALKLRRVGMMAKDLDFEQQQQDQQDQQKQQQQAEAADTDALRHEDTIYNVNNIEDDPQLTEEDEKDLQQMALRLLPKGAAIAPKVDGRITELP